MPGQHATVQFYIMHPVDLITRGAIVAFSDDRNMAIVTAVWGRNNYGRQWSCLCFPYTALYGTSLHLCDRSLMS